MYDQLEIDESLIRVCKLFHHRYSQFKEFTVDREEGRLLRSGEPVALTPKAFNLLIMLVDNRGRIIDKHELLSSLWGDSFVEEGNVAFTVRLVRKALGDDPADPKFIETIPRRGYRFIAEVTDGLLDIGQAEQTIQAPAPPFKHQNLLARWALVVLLLALGLGLAGVYGWPFGRGSDKVAGVLDAPFRVERLSNDGNAGHAAISNDGRFVVFSTGLHDERSTLNIRYLESGQTKEIVGPVNGLYMGVAITPDDSGVYFVRTSLTTEQQPCLFRISLDGGIPEELSCGMEGWIDISNDGRLISFVRCPYRDEEYCSLYVADEHGKAERKIASRASPMRIGSNSFSPDGHSLAFASGQSRENGDNFGVFVVNVLTGKEKAATTERFFNVKNIDWLPDGRSMLISAKKRTDETFFFWHLNPGNGSVRPLKKDAMTYNAVSLSAAGDLLVSTVVDGDFRLFIGDLLDRGRPNPIGRAMTPHFLPDGRIAFASDRAGRTNIWLSNSDGTNAKRLTAEGVSSFPITNPDATKVYFSSNLSGRSEVWGMNIDGSSPRQLTRSEGGFPLAVSPNGEWVYYLSAFSKKLRRVSTGGERELAVSPTSLEKTFPTLALSPGTDHAAIVEQVNGSSYINVVRLEDWRSVKQIPLTVVDRLVVHVAWSKNGNLLYVLKHDKSLNAHSIWRISLDGSKPEKLIDLSINELGERSGFAVSHDDRNFAIVHGGWKHDVVLIRGLN